MPKFVGIDISGYQVGSMIEIGTTSLPFGFLACDGSAVSRTDYAALFNVIGTTYGVGDGSTTFNIPDFQGRAAMGAGSYSDPTSGPITRTVGQIIGEEAHVLVIAEMPSHNHGIPQTYTDIYNAVRNVSAPATPQTTGNPTTPWTLGYNGGDTSHNNMQPSLGVQKAIAYV